MLGPLSGLSLAGRSGLKSLIDDVRAGRADFDQILVYDVSRWGRFKDADESAFSEHQCRIVASAQAVRADQQAWTSRLVEACEA